MGRKSYLLLVALLASAVLAAGCGGDDSGDGGGDGGDVAGDINTTTSGGETSASDPAVAQQIASCKQSVEAARGISNDVKKELRELCEEAATGDEAEARKASQQVCVRIIEETIPAGPARDTGVQACKQSNQ
jgi:hypothetical protein